ncbi:LacI family DNA-binding transcriptional regulator [Paenibacillus sp.]|uniref:LacI family DNA-binding transcriptional regulator n=1 Tax=Paenibacillus sp. TaxID=58172 RepID=UPI0025F65EBE|nr:LacI family DNA-binding transcriptional regulator [Paenibacillus sp.]
MLLLPTIIDISRACGLSKSTVSRVLNNHPHVSEDSRAKVMEAVQKLGYVRNLHGVQLRLQESRNIGVLIPDVEHPFFSQLVSALSRSLSSRGYRLVIYQTEYSQEYEREVYARLRCREIDAVIVVYSHYNEKEIQEFIGTGVAIICNEAMEGEFLDVFRLDEQDAVYQATIYLLSKGRCRLLFGMDHKTLLQEKRWLGFQQALQDSGEPCLESQCHSGLITMEDGYAWGERLFASTTWPDGIITGSDYVAAGLLKAAEKHGVSIPEQVSVIGFDNHPVGQMTSPELTTIPNCIPEMTKDVTECLVQRLEGVRSAPLVRTYKTSLIIRQSG